MEIGRIFLKGCGSGSRGSAEPGLGSVASVTSLALWPLGVLGLQEQHCYGQELHLKVGYLMYSLQSLHKVLQNREIGNGSCGVRRGNWLGGFGPLFAAGPGLLSAVLSLGRARCYHISHTSSFITWIELVVMLLLAVHVAQVCKETLLSLPCLLGIILLSFHLPG